MTSRFAWSLTAALAVHAAIAGAARLVPRPQATPDAAVIEVAMIEAPEPEPVPVPVPVPVSVPDPETKTKTKTETETGSGSGSASEPDRTPTRKRARVRTTPAPEPEPAPEPAPAPAAPAPAPSRFAVAMESTVTTESGVAVPTGRTGGTDGTGGQPGGRGRTGAGGQGGAGGGSAAGSGGSTGGRTLPRLVRAVDPIYPSPARRLRIEGRVTLRLDIDRNGKVVGARVVRGLGHGLDEAAAAAARQLEFSPGTVGGAPTRMSISFSFRFVLDP